jgi:hypothetical protein
MRSKWELDRLNSVYLCSLERTSSCLHMLELRSVCKDSQLQEVTRINRGVTTCLVCRIAPSYNSAIFQEIYNYNKIIMILFPKPAYVFIQLWVICPGYLFYHIYIGFGFQV